MTSLEAAQLRLALHYARIIGALGDRYHAGSNGALDAIEAFQLEWPQILSTVRAGLSSEHSALVTEAVRILRGSFFLMNLTVPAVERAELTAAASSRLPMIDGESLRIGVLADHANNLRVTGAVDHSLNLNRRAIHLASQIRAPLDEGRALLFLAHTYHAKLGQPVRALACARRASRTFRRTRAKWWRAATQRTIGTCLQKLDRGTAATRAMRHGLGLAEELGEPRLLMTCLGSMAMIESELGNTSGAKALLHRASRMAADLADPFNEAVYAARLAREADDDDSPAEAAQLRSYAADLWGRAGAVESEVRDRILAASLYREANLLTRASEELGHCRHLVAGLGSTKWVRRFHLTEAKILAELPSRPQAAFRVSLARAIRTARRSGDTKELSRTFGTIGGIFSDLGSHKDAYRWHRRALAESQRASWGVGIWEDACFTAEALAELGYWAQLRHVCRQFWSVGRTHGEKEDREVMLIWLAMARAYEGRSEVLLNRFSSVARSIAGRRALSLPDSIRSRL